MSWASRGARRPRGHNSCGRPRSCSTATGSPAPRWRTSARAAGVTKGAFYFHFSSKDELGGAIHGEASEMLRAAADRIGSKGDLVRALVDLTHEVAGWLESDPLVRASFRTARECGHRDPRYLAFYDEWQRTVATLVRGAAQAGQLRPTVLVDDVTTLVLTVVAGAETLSWTGGRQGGVRAGLTGMWRLVLPGIVPDERLPRLLVGWSSGG